MITFKVTNTRVENDTIVVFYEFSNNISMTNHFPMTASFVEIMAWGNEKLVWLEAREFELAQLQEQLAHPIEEAI